MHYAEGDLRCGRAVLGGSVYFVVSADRKQEDCFRSFVLDKFEENPQVISPTASPDAFQVALELVRLESWIERILGQQQESGLQVLGGLRVLLQVPSRRTDERRTSDEFTIHHATPP